MARQDINLGTAPTGAGGDTTRSTGVKINAMMTELYARNAQLGTASNANVTTSATSGVTGEVLRVGDFGIGGTAPYLTNKDLNSVVSGGFFYVISTVNGPVPYDGFLINSPVDTNTCSQIFIVVNTRDTYLRIKSSGSWSAWEMLVNNRNAVTDPGLNAGGIVFSGSNANGSFTKFADGTLICKFTSSTSVAMAGAVGNVWQSSSSVFTFPAIFTSPPSVTPTTTESVNSICWSTILGAISVSSVAIGAQAPISTATTKLGYIAVGRWY